MKFYSVLQLGRSTGFSRKWVGQGLVSVGSARFVATQVHREWQSLSVHNGKPAFALTRSFSASVKRYNVEAQQTGSDENGSSTKSSEEGDVTSIIPIERIRNIAIIAHVDHGKTTLVDQLLKQSGVLSGESFSTDRVMDSNQLEKERGITILSKSTGVFYKGHRINIVDTPGHADFGGEVERVLSNVDGVCLVVCASDGPMAQTKYVLSKALQKGLKPIVVLNKVDRPGSRPDEVEEELLELFIGLDAEDHQLDYKTVYASAKQGWAKINIDDPESKTITPLLDTIINEIPHPKNDRSKPFSMVVTQVRDDPYIGKMYLGKIHTGKISIGSPIHVLASDNSPASSGKISKIILHRGVENIEMKEAAAGDIVSIAGVSDGHVNDTIGDPLVTESLPHATVDPPTIAMSFYVNDSPLAGKEGKFLTSQAIRDRLLKEGETNIALKITDKGDSFEVKGRGELQIGVLIETMRREGFELSISPPRVLFRRGEKPNQVLEPVEEVTITCPSESAGTVVEKLTKRKGELKTYDDIDGTTKLVFYIPTRGLLGYPSEFKNDTRGSGALNYILHGYEEYKGPIDQLRKGAMLATETGVATSFAIHGAEARGKLFIQPGDKVYKGMVIGESSRDSDIDINACKNKAISNVRNVAKDEMIKLIPVIPMSLESMITYIQDDEVVEVTPTDCRVRKRDLDPSKRKLLRNKNQFTFEDE